MHLGSDADQKYTQQAQAVVDARDKGQGGVLSSFDQLKGGVDPAVAASLPDGFYLSDFSVRNVEIVGPQVGAQVAPAGPAGHGLFPGRNADLPGIPLRVDLRRRRRGHRLSRHVDHRGFFSLLNKRHFSYRNRRHPDLDWLL